MTTCVIVAINTKYIHSSLAPWYLYTAVKEKYPNTDNNGIDIAIFETTINESIERIFAGLTNIQADIYGLSCYIWNISIIKKLVPLIKNKFPNSIIILGGPEVSYNTKEVFSSIPDTDYIIAGEGEKSFTELVGLINLGETPEKGLYNSSESKNTFEPPSPYCKEYFDALNGRIAYLETSRGCPFSCAFCLSGQLGNVSFFDLERSKQDIMLLGKADTKTVKLVDRTFNANPKRAYSLFEFVIENFRNGTFTDKCFHFEIAGDILDERTIELLSSAPVGCIQLEIGIQSTNPAVLNAIYRHTDSTKVLNNIKRLAVNSNLHVHVDLIAGLPNEDLKSFAKGFNEVYDTKPHMLQLGFLKLLNGAAMRTKQNEFPCRYSPEPPYEIIDTPVLSENDLIYLHKVEDAVERLYNSGKFKFTLEFLVNNVNCTPFELFADFGEYAFEKMPLNCSLNFYTKLLFDYFTEFKHVQPEKLLDAIIEDRVVFNITGVLPNELMYLYQPNKNIKKVLSLLEQDENTASKKGIKRRIAFLKALGKYIYTDVSNRNPVTGQYDYSYYE